MTMIELPVIDTPPPSMSDDEFDLDVRVSVGADAELPEAGFSCSWYSCRGTCSGKSPCIVACQGSPTTQC
ncbi:FDLD family class I lanthipeptide [Glycomyces harbinensis]|uniref:FxLD family lantipeptide n=1 Tax=Glycomyces harbinensis TaxID=58114 RepID=A0A1G6WTB5_9ACTN|nr:FDLD family class I lanthipeptide [Glycomyces harbinensis]SDD69061.1 hypothetical protein SAMN05216270_106198 [Glycomyces harbinensis]